MELPQRPSRSQTRSRKCLCIGLPILIVALLLVTIVPTAVVLTKKHEHRDGFPAGVLLPLSLYPTNEAWDPLYKAIEKAPKLNFTIIVDPNNGPGGMTDLMHFKPALQKLAAFPNVQTVGYVQTKNGTRSTSEVQQDVLQYSTWSNMPLNCTINGIFFDRTPYVKSEKTDIYLDIINNFASSANGIRGEKTIFHGPAGLPQKHRPEAIQVFSESYKTFLGLEDMLEHTAAATGAARYEFGYLLHSMPKSASMKELVGNMSVYTQNFFVTDSAVIDGKSFGGKWEEFVDAMEKTN